MDREALEHSLVRRLIDHLDHGTTDMADDVMEIPSSVYTSREHFEDELRYLFYSFPLVLACSGGLPGPGTYRTVDMCGTPVLLTRDANGKVRSFANICRHRGVRVVDGGGEGRRFTCPFHAWVYDLEGKLVGVPTAEGFEGMCREDKGLVELPVDEGFGLIVGRLRPGPPVNVEEFLGPGITEELTALDYGGWAIWSDPHTHRVNANWKVTLDTFRENYHFNKLHSTTLATWAYGGALLFDPFGLHLRNCTALRSIDEVRGAPEEQWGTVTRHFSYQYNFFPNTCLSFDARHVELWQILPVDEQTSEVLHAAYLRPGLTPEEHSLALDQMPWICSEVVDAQDFWVASRTEPGIRTGIVDTVVIGRNEPTLQHLHRSFLSVIASAKEDQVKV